jgi:hypothetical protein
MIRELTNREKAHQAWGDELPDWIAALADYADRYGQRATGIRLQSSAGFVSRVINNKYGAGLKKAEEQVRAAIMAATIECPEWGQIPSSTCRKNRNRTGPPTNFFRQRFAESCPECPLNPDRKDCE